MKYSHNYLILINKKVEDIKHKRKEAMTLPI